MKIILDCSYGSSTAHRHTHTHTNQEQQRLTVVQRKYFKHGLGLSKRVAHKVKNEKTISIYTTYTVLIAIERRLLHILMYITKVHVHVVQRRSHLGKTQRKKAKEMKAANFGFLFLFRFSAEERKNDVRSVL